MSPHWRRLTKCIPNHLLFWRVGQMLFGTNHVTHAHRDVVDHIGQQEHRRTISAQQHKVFNGFVGKFNATAH